MKRHVRALWVVVALLALTGCRHKRAGEPAGMASTIHMGNPRSADQLAGGFHEIEAGAWRWTEKRFAVLLHPPAGSQQKGATLELKLTVPPVSIEKLGPVTLSGSIAGTPLAPEVYSKPGDYVYRREVAPSALGEKSVRVDFQLDRAMPPGGGDMRELGIVVLSAGLVSR